MTGINGLPQFIHDHPENLVFQGGGPKGLAYLGVVKVLESRGALQSVKRVAGTSAGAINAVFISLNYSCQAMMKLMKETNFSTFLDVDGTLNPTAKEAFNGLVKGTMTLGDAVRNLADRTNGIWAYAKGTIPGTKPFDIMEDVFPSLKGVKGFCKGTRILRWIENNIAKQVKEVTGLEGKLLTFGELRQHISKGKPFKHLYVYATQDPDLTVTFSSEDPKCDDFIISDAIRASLSIPIVFVPHTMYKKVNGKRIACSAKEMAPLVEGIDYKFKSLPNDNRMSSLIDGGVRNNFPMLAFDELRFIDPTVKEKDKRKPGFNNRTLCICLYSPEERELASKNPQNLYEIFLSLAKNFAQADSIRQMNPFYNHRIIEIDNQGVRLTQFDLSDVEKTNLISAGKKATTVFFEAMESRLLTEFNADCNEADAQFGINRQQALQLYLEIIKNHKLDLGDKHPFLTGSKVAYVLNNTGLCYYSEHKYAEALGLFYESLELYKSSLGDAHPNVATLLTNVNLSEQHLNPPHDKHKIWQATMEKIATRDDQHIKDLQAKKDHNALKALKNLAICEYKKENYLKALRLYVMVNAIHKEPLGNDDPKILDKIMDCRRRNVEKEMKKK